MIYCVHRIASFIDVSKRESHLPCVIVITDGWSECHQVSCIVVLNDDDFGCICMMDSSRSYDVNSLSLFTISVYDFTDI